MNLPQDPYLKVQYMNMLLKTNHMDLYNFCASVGIDGFALEYELGRAGYRYDADKRQFVI